MDHSHHSHEMQHSHDMSHSDASSHKHEAKSSGSEMCIVENRDVEIYDNLSPTQIAAHVWERCKPRSSFMTKKPSVSARRAQLMRVHLLSKPEPCPGRETESTSLDEKHSGMSKQNSSKHSSRTKCPKKRDTCSSESSEENDIAYACPSECDVNEDEDDYEGEDDEDGDEEGGKCYRY